MSYHGKLQTLKNGTADAEIQLWAYLQLEKEQVELTDEEILNVAFGCEVDTVSIQNDWDGTVIDFARAILKKAQEK